MSPSWLFALLCKLFSFLLCSRSRSQQHFRMSVNACPDDFFSESLNLLLPNLVWWCIIMSQIVFQKDWFSVFKVKVTVNNNVIKIWLFNILSELLILLQLHLVWWYIIIGWIVLWRLDFSVVVKVKVTEMVQNSRDCSSGQFLCSCWTFCNQTWYGDATSLARVSCKKIGLLSSSSGSKGSFDQIWLFLPHLLNCWSSCNQI